DAFAVLGATISPDAKFGAGALSVTGTNYAVVGETPGIDITGPITVEAWVNLNQFPNAMNGPHFGYAPILARWDDVRGPFGSYVLSVTPDGSVRFDISHTGKYNSCNLPANTGPFTCATVDNAFVISANKIAVKKWYHIVGVYTGTTLQIFVNGV